MNNICKHIKMTEGNYRNKQNNIKVTYDTWKWWWFNGNGPGALPLNTHKYIIGISKITLLMPSGLIYVFLQPDSFPTEGVYFYWYQLL